MNAEMEYAILDAEEQQAWRTTQCCSLKYWSLANAVGTLPDGHAELLIGACQEYVAAVKAHAEAKLALMSWRST